MLVFLFFSKQTLFFFSTKISYVPAKCWRNKQNPNARWTDGTDRDTWSKIDCDESLAQCWTKPLKLVPFKDHRIIVSAYMKSSIKVKSVQACKSSNKLQIN